MIGSTWSRSALVVSSCLLGSLGCADVGSGDAPGSADDTTTESSAVTARFPAGSTLRTTTALNLRAGPSSADAIRTVMPADATVTLATDPGPTNGFYHVRYGTLEEMLKAEKLDILMVGSPNHMHLDHIRTGLEAGCKVFTEKPVVTTVAETFALARLIHQYGSDNVMVGLVLRYAPLAAV